MFVSSYLDPFFIRLEGALFGYQPSLTFMTAVPYRSVSELFYGAYFSYYLMISGVGVALFIRQRQQFLRYLSVLCFLFYACYLCYIILPEIGSTRGLAQTSLVKAVRFVWFPTKKLDRSMCPEVILEYPGRFRGLHSNLAADFQCLRQHHHFDSASAKSLFDPERYHAGQCRYFSSEQIREKCNQLGCQETAA